MEKAAKKIIVLIGPTASGKSSLALKVAGEFCGEIVSCDSMQIYKNMDIGTAKPNNEEKERIPHHMIDICSCKDNYSAGDYAKDASAAIDDIISRGKTPIVCGGTGMYLDTLLRPVAFSYEQDEGKSLKIREDYKRFYEENGAEALHKKLEEVDPESAREIHPNNVKRVIRALEIYCLTGVKKSEHDKNSLSGESPYLPFFINLMYENRETLYKRIDDRVDTMMANGLEEEVRGLVQSGELVKDSTAAQAIGYREFFDYFEGKLSLEETVSLIKKDSRNYAKRQLTWFRKYTPYTSVNDGNTSETIFASVKDEIKSFIETTM